VHDSRPVINPFAQSLVLVALAELKRSRSCGLGDGARYVR
jgi:hypothetical protein